METTIWHYTTTKFGIADRLKILVGKKVVTHSTIIVDKEVTVIRSSVTAKLTQ